MWFIWFVAFFLFDKNHFTASPLKSWRQAVYSRWNTKLTIKLDVYKTAKPGSHCHPLPSLGDRHDSHVTQCSIKRERYNKRLFNGQLMIFFKLILFIQNRWRFFVKSSARAYNVRNLEQTMVFGLNMWMLKGGGS